MHCQALLWSLCTCLGYSVNIKVSFTKLIGKVMGLTWSELHSYLSHSSRRIFDSAFHAAIVSSQVNYAIGRSQFGSAMTMYLTTRETITPYLTRAWSVSCQRIMRRVFLRFPHRIVPLTEIIEEE